MNRSDLACPKCDSELEASPYADEYNKKNSKILKGTRCSNTNCEYHVGVSKDVMKDLTELEDPSDSTAEKIKTEIKSGLKVILNWL